MSVAVCGSSGVAAALVGGVTAHSWAGFRKGHDDEVAPLEVVLNQVIPSAAKARTSRAQVMVIDEATTLSATFYRRLGKVLQYIRGDLSPFGGLVVLFAGDFLQVCPPRGEYAFKNAVWNRLFGSRAMMLESNYRQSADPDFLQLLLRLRLETFQAVDRCIAPYLNATRATHLLDSATKAVGVMKLRVGATVIVLSNALASKGVAAGSRRIVRAFSRVRRVHLPAEEIELPSGTTNLEVVGPTEARVVAIDGVNKAATRWQLPLVLAWASTVHGAQGWTLKRVAADLSEAFAPGQVLSSLSRTRRLCDVFLVGFDESKILVCPDALAFYSCLSAL